MKPLTKQTLPQRVSEPDRQGSVDVGPLPSRQGISPVALVPTLLKRQTLFVFNVTHSPTILRRYLLFDPLRCSTFHPWPLPKRPDPLFKPGLPFLQRLVDLNIIVWRLSGGSPPARNFFLESLVESCRSQSTLKIYDTE